MIEIEVLLFLILIAICHGNGKLTLLLNNARELRKQMDEATKRLETANEMHGELNRAAQWLIDNRGGRISNRGNSST